MKVLGITKTEEGYPRDAYIALVSHDELKAVQNKASYADRDSMPVLKIGEEFDLGKGYHYRQDIVEACKAMKEAYTKFAKVAPLAAQFAGVVIEKDSIDS